MDRESKMNLVFFKKSPLSISLSFKIFFLHMIVFNAILKMNSSYYNVSLCM